MNRIALVFTLGAAAAATAVFAAEKARGYLSVSDVDAIAVIGDPPAPGSAREQADLEAYRRGAELVGSERWAAATADDDVDGPAVLKRYACALNAELTPQSAPATVRLLERTLRDAVDIGETAKQHYRRARPFVSDATDAPLCIDIPAERRATASFTYPSGHATLGSVWGLVLSQAAPERTSQIMARTRVFAESRLVCRVHYASDVAAGERLGSAVFARLQASEAYRADVAAAAAEIAAAPKPANCG